MMLALCLICAAVGFIFGVFVALEIRDRADRKSREFASRVITSRDTGERRIYRNRLIGMDGGKR